MISVDGTVVIQIVNFLLLIWVLNIILYRPIRNILIQRKEKIQGLEQKILTSEQDARDKDDAFAKAIKEARAKGLKVKEGLVQEAVAAEQAMVAEINRKAQAKMAEVQGKIEQDIGAVKASLLEEIDAFAEIIGQKILGRTA